MFTETILIETMAFIERHPKLIRALLRPVANAPLLSRHLKVLPRGFMGATAFELHDVDVEQGRIGIGGVDEIILSSKFIELFHKVIIEKTGSEEKMKEILYEVGRQGGYWEVDQAMKHDRWAPRKLMALLEENAAMDNLRENPQMARFFSLSLKMISKLIKNEGGWGHLEEVNFKTDPIRITIRNTQESRWMGPAKEPVCHMDRGVLAGYCSRLFQGEFKTREVECAAMGAPLCVFEIYQ